MFKSSRFRILAVAFGALTISACSPAQMAWFTNVTSPHSNMLTPGQLTVLRDCESSGRYDAIGGSGAFRGAYQFNQATWDDTAGRHYPWLIGSDPAATEFYWQDAMAKALYAERGASPWPHCGSKL